MSAARDRRSRNVWLAVTAIAVTAVDQLSKVWAVAALEGKIIDVVWTLRLHLVYNTGFAFSSGKGLGPVLAVAAIVIVGVLWSSRRRVVRTWPTVGLGAIIGGALGNLSDRVFRGDAWGSGGVVDFIDLQWWPIFNVADAGITIGLAGLLVHLYRGERRSREAS